MSLHRFPQARELARWILLAVPRRRDRAGRPRRRIARARRPRRRAATAYSRAGDRRRRLRGPGPRRAARVRRGRPGRGGGRRPRRGRRRHATRASRATRSASTTSRSARRSSPTGDAAGARAAFEAALAVRPDLPAALVGLAKLDAFDGDLSTRDRRARHGDRRDPAARLARAPVRPADAPRRGRATPRKAAGRPADDRGDRAARRRGRQRLRPRPVPLPVRPRPRARARGHASPATSSPSAPTSTATTPWPGRCSTRATPPAPTPRCSRALAAGTKDARLWYHAGLIAARQRASRRGRAPTSAARLRSGRPWTRSPATRATDALATIR